MKWAGVLLTGWLAAAATVLAQAPAVATAPESSTSSLDEAAVLGPPRGTPLTGAELDDATRELGDRMRCPVCQGLSIAASPSSSAIAMLGQVRELLARGYTREQVLEYFVRSYGEFVLLEPTAEGWNLLVWLLPLVGLLLGAALIVLRVRAARRRGAVASGPGDGQDLDAYLERVRSEVRS